MRNPKTCGQCYRALSRGEMARRLARAGSAPLRQCAGAFGKAHLNLAAVTRIGHNTKAEHGVGKDCTGFEALACRVRTGIARAPAAEKLFVAKDARPSAGTHFGSCTALRGLSRPTRPIGVLLLAGVAMHATDFSVDDGMDGMGEYELASVAPSVDIAPDDLAGHTRLRFQE